MRSRRRRALDRRFDNGVVGGRQRVAVVSVRSLIEGWIESPDVCTLTNSSASPIGIRIEYFDVRLAKTMAGVGSMLHNSRFVVAVEKCLAFHALADLADSPM